MARRIKISGTPFAGLYLLQRQPIGDARGFLERVYCGVELEAALAGAAIRAVNLTRTERSGTLRGLHYQRSPHAEDKIVSCLRGRVYDVVVDLRRGSATFLQWYAQELSDHNRLSMLVPKGFAHGFQTLEEGCEMLYLHTESHHPGSEGGIDATDPALGITWPTAITERSKRDCAHAAIDRAFEGLDP